MNELTTITTINAECCVCKNFEFPEKTYFGFFLEGGKITFQKETEIYKQQ